MGNKKKIKKLKKLFDKWCNEDYPETSDYVGCDEPECQAMGKCDCHQYELQVCDTCQGTGADCLDNIQCDICKEWKHPNTFIDVDDRHCHACHNECHGRPRADEQLNQGHYFEIMDRVHVAQCMIDDHITNHPAITPKMKKKLNKAQKQLTKVYQLAGTESNHFDYDTTTFNVSG